jgi:hypothetical protein
MRYMMLMNTPRGTGDYQVNNWAPEDFKAHIAFMQRFNKDIIESGEFVSAQGLTPPGQAKLVRAGRDGAPVTDGVFPESKEFLAGFWIIDVEGPERAYALAAKVSTAPGAGGAPMNMGIELREVMAAPPVVE